MSEYWANAWYLFEYLETSNSLYGETCSMLLRNHGILQNNFINIASNCVPFIGCQEYSVNKEFQPKMPSRRDILGNWQVNFEYGINQRLDYQLLKQPLKEKINKRESQDLTSGCQ
ncbi:hypothetical protein T02_6251 [Trichinella nativa]|uniref:Uncharacterized protein n=1 Tax=Trichinella nativa TaxID=6335 RepID=A0A0V1KKB6_9BILA|nr:hypothetical protein T02_6251 [Trichinella nativa]